MFKVVFRIAAVLGLVLFLDTSNAFAVQESLGDVAENLTESFVGLAKLMTSGGYLLGLGFALAAIMKFKQHKDNPTQIPIGTPIALVFIAASLIFLPSLLDATGNSLFRDGGNVAGPKGVIYTNQGIVTRY